MHKPQQPTTSSCLQQLLATCCAVAPLQVIGVLYVSSPRPSVHSTHLQREKLGVLDLGCFQNGIHPGPRLWVLLEGLEHLLRCSPLRLQARR